MSFEVRKATPLDAKDLLTILQEAGAFKLTRGDEIWGRYGFTIEEVEETISQGETFIATIGKQPAGSVKILWNDERIWGSERGNDEQAIYVHRLTVSDEFRGQGIGEQIMNWVTDKARIAGRRFVRLDCSITNEGLCSYYEGLGFEIVDRLVLPNYDPVLFQKAV